MKPTVINLLSAGTRFLKKAGLASYRISAERLLEFVLNGGPMMPPAEHLAEATLRSESRRAEQPGVAALYLDRLRTVPKAARGQYFELLRRRAKRYPLQYLIGEAHFMDFAFEVNEHCLIPRPETELLVEAVLRELRALIPSGEARVLDIGTGSGNIALSLARYLPFAEIWASDVSGEALKLAERNAERLEVRGRVKFVRGNLFQTLGDAQFECIVSNPPYLSAADLRALDGELNYEPVLALDGGKNNGTALMTVLAREARKHLRSGGLLAFELGLGQANVMKEMLRELGYKNVRVERDYAGIERMIVAHWHGKAATWTKLS